MIPRPRPLVCTHRQLSLEALEPRVVLSAIGSSHYRVRRVERRRPARCRRRHLRLAGDLQLRRRLPSTCRAAPDRRRHQSHEMDVSRGRDASRGRVSHRVRVEQERVQAGRRTAHQLRAFGRRRVSRAGGRRRRRPSSTPTRQSFRHRWRTSPTAARSMPTGGNVTVLANGAQAQALGPHHGRARRHLAQPGI